MFLFTHLFEMIYETYANSVCIKADMKLNWHFNIFLQAVKVLRKYFLIF